MGEYLTSTWEEFEAWIRRTIGSNFRWKIRPRDNYGNRKIIADLIRNAMNRNNGVFPRNDAFIDPVEESKEQLDVPTYFLYLPSKNLDEEG